MVYPFSVSINPPELFTPIFMISVQPFGRYSSCSSKNTKVNPYLLHDSIYFEIGCLLIPLLSKTNNSTYSLKPLLAPVVNSLSLEFSWLYKFSKLVFLRSSWKLRFLTPISSLFTCLSHLSQANLSQSSSENI